MESGQVGSSTHKVFVFLLMPILAGCLLAQSQSGTMRGRVTDPSGAVIPQATVTATASNGQKAVSVSNAQGVYEIKGLQPGSYTVSSSALGFATDTEQNIALAAGQVLQFDIGL